MVTVGIVGAGSIARRHARACAEVAEAELVAVCDERPEAAAQLAGEAGARRHHGGLDAMLAAGPLDVAIVSTWGNSHAAVVEALARSGRVGAILCEKPFSLTGAEALAMERAAREAGVLLAEAFKFRHHPVHLAAAELIAAGRIGPVSHVRSTFATNAPPALRTPGANWRFDARRGGGAVYDLACYCIHHARFALGDEPTRVFASGRPAEGSGVEERVAATMEFPGGRTAQWWVSFGDQPSQEVEIFGPRGRLRIDRAWNNEDQPTTLEVAVGDGPVESIDVAPVFQFALQLQHLCDCLRTGQPHRIPTADSVAQMRVVDAVRASMCSGAPAAVAADRQPAAR